MATMTLAERPRGADCYLIEVGGEVDLTQTDRLGAAIRRGAAERPLVLLDLSRCRFMDSSAIATIILGNLELERRSRRLALLSPGAEVMRILAIAGLAERDLVFADERAARAALRPP